MVTDSRLILLQSRDYPSRDRHVDDRKLFSPIFFFFLLIVLSYSHVQFLCFFLFFYLLVRISSTQVSNTADIES